MQPLSFPAEPAKADALIIVPPFADLNRPALGPHLLQACAEKAGYTVHVLYANLAFAAEIGEEAYSTLCRSGLPDLLGERLFAAKAFSVPLLGKDADGESFSALVDELTCDYALSMDSLRDLAKLAGKWTDLLAQFLIDQQCRIVGCSSSFQQLTASIALLQEIKEIQPEILTLLGGSNCEDMDPQAILSMTTSINYVFSGESELVFCRFLKQVESNNLPKEGVITCPPATTISTIPSPNFSQFYRQLRHFLPHSFMVVDQRVWLPYEGSRGCSREEVNGCPACEIRHDSKKYREKSADRIIYELRKLTLKHPSNWIVMSDRSLSPSGFNELIPRLRREVLGLHICRRQDSMLSLDQIEILRKAGIAALFPTFSSLSSSILEWLGTSWRASDAVALMRYARSLSMPLYWNLLFDIPGDKMHDYKQTITLAHALRHLQPPMDLSPFQLDRFSSFFRFPEQYGIASIRPVSAYEAILPEEADIDLIARQFVGDYKSAARDYPELWKTLAKEVTAWRQSWDTADLPPILEVFPLSLDLYLLIDTRKLSHSQEISFLSRAQASLVLAGLTENNQEELKWAQRHRLVIELEGTLVPLATTAPDVLREFESEFRATQKADLAM